MAKSYYEILEVDSKASEAEIRKAYRKKMREYHPDLNPDKTKAEQRTRDLNIALEVLTDPAKRKRYDEKLQRMGKAEANAEFDFTGDKKRSEDEMPEFEFDNNKSKPKKPNARQAKKRKMNPIWMMLSMATAGISAVCVSLLVLWVFFRLDPSGLIAAETGQPDFEATNSGRTVLASNELKKIWLELKSTNARIDSITSKETGVGSTRSLLRDRTALKDHHTIQGVDGPDSTEPIELAIKPPPGRHIIFSTIVAFSEKPMVTDIRAEIRSNRSPVSPRFVVAFDQTNQNIGTLTIPVIVDTDGTKEFRVWVSRAHKEQVSKIHQGSSLEFVQLSN